MCIQSSPFPYYGFVPPLRLVLTTECNGTCRYCHHEGEPTKGQFMSVPLAVKCAKAAELFKIPELSLTGGEPTLHPDLYDIFNQIQNSYHGNISLTTNGYMLQNHHLSTPIHTINLSISSFSKVIYNKYQRVNPVVALNDLLQFPAMNKNVNIVVTSDNYNEIENILKQCKEHSISVDIMFELKKYTEHDLFIQRHVLSIIESYGTPYIQLNTTFTIIISGRDNFHIRIKHPKLSKMINRKICLLCEKSSVCHERVCAVRVYPDGLVSACLNKQHSFLNDNITDRINEAYNRLSPNTAILSTLLC